MQARLLSRLRVAACVLCPVAILRAYVRPDVAPTAAMVTGRALHRALMTRRLRIL